MVIIYYKMVEATNNDTPLVENTTGPAAEIQEA